MHGKECKRSSRKNQSLLALEGTPALIKPNGLVLLIGKPKSRATRQACPRPRSESQQTGPEHRAQARVSQETSPPSSFIFLQFLLLL